MRWWRRYSGSRLLETRNRQGSWEVTLYNLSGMRHRARMLSPEEKCLLDRCRTQIFLAVNGLWCPRKVNLLASGKKKFSNVVVTSHSSCVFLYLFSSANILPVSFVSHLQDWWCVGKRETSFPVNKLWLIYLPPSLWPLTMYNLLPRVLRWF